MTKYFHSMYNNLLLPVVKISTVSKVSTAQLARFPNICQTGQHGHFHWIIFTKAIKLLPTLCIAPAHAIKFSAQFPETKAQMQKHIDKPNEYLICIKFKLHELYFRI